METKKIHFIGIGGIGISGLARLYVYEGWEVSGTNDNPSPQTLDALRAQGVEISLDQSVLPEADKYVYSDAWLTMNPGLLEQARATGKPTMNYFEALGKIANQYYLIAVAGTHGKTTTTAMLIDIMEDAGLDPTAIVGSLRTRTGSNFRAGRSKYFVVEADEYRRHFLYLRPDILVITNVDFDHPDYFKDISDVQAAFRTLIDSLNSDATVVYNRYDQNTSYLMHERRGKVKEYNEVLNNPYFIKTKLLLPGRHNLENAAAAAAAMLAIGSESGQEVNIDTIITSLENFAGIKRRFEYKGDVNGAPVYDDYAHNPQKVAAAIAGAREKYPKRKLVVVFQPHTFSRTKELRAEFEAALKKADEVILVPIYASRETGDGSITSEMLAEAIGARHFHTLKAAAEAVKEMATPEHAVLVMGAGDVTSISDMLTV